MFLRFVARVSAMVAVSLLGSVSAFAELPDQLRLDHLGIEAGLSSSAVSRIIQDDNGFIWFATQSGLNRYDGYAVERYEHDPFHRNSLSHNLVQTMYHDDSGIFWIGTHGGLNRFDPESEEFRHYESDPQSLSSLSNNVVVAITRDAEDNLWVGTLNGLNRLDAETGRFAQYMDGDPDAGELPDKVVRSLALDARGTLWVGTYGGLSRYLPGEDAFETVADGPGRRGEPDGSGASIAGAEAAAARDLILAAERCVAETSPGSRGSCLRALGVLRVSENTRAKEQNAPRKTHCTHAPP